MPNTNNPFDNLEYAPYVSTFVGQPIADMKALNLKKEQDYQQVLADFDVSKGALNAIKPFNESDSAKLREIQDELAGTIGAMTEEGNLKNKGENFRKYVGDLSSNRGLAELQASIAKRNSEIEAASKDDKINMSEFEQDLRHADLMYESSGGWQKNPVTGRFESNWSKPNTPHEYTAIKDVMDVFAGKFKADGIEMIDPETGRPILQQVGGDGQSYLYYIDGEEVTPERVQSAIQSYLATNPKYLETLDAIVRRGYNNKFLTSEGYTEPTSKDVLDSLVNSQTGAGIMKKYGITSLDEENIESALSAKGVEPSQVIREAIATDYQGNIINALVGTQAYRNTDITFKDNWEYRSALDYEAAIRKGNGSGSEESGEPDPYVSLISNVVTTNKVSPNDMETLIQDWVSVDSEYTTLNNKLNSLNLNDPNLDPASVAELRANVEASAIRKGQLLEQIQFVRDGIIDNVGQETIDTYYKQYEEESAKQSKKALSNLDFARNDILKDRGIEGKYIDGKYYELKNGKYYSSNSLPDLERKDDTNDINMRVPFTMLNISKSPTYDDILQDKLEKAQEVYDGIKLVDKSRFTANTLDDYARGKDGNAYTRNTAWNTLTKQYTNKASKAIYDKIGSIENIKMGKNYVTISSEAPLKYNQVAQLAKTAESKILSSPDIFQKGNMNLHGVVKNEIGLDSDEVDWEKSKVTPLFAVENGKPLYSISIHEYKKKGDAQRGTNVSGNVVVTMDGSNASSVMIDIAEKEVSDILSRAQIGADGSPIFSNNQDRENYGVLSKFYAEMSPVGKSLDDINIYAMNAGQSKEWNIPNVGKVDIVALQDVMYSKDTDVGDLNYSIKLKDGSTWGTNKQGDLGYWDDATLSSPIMYDTAAEIKADIGGRFLNNIVQNKKATSGGTSGGNPYLEVMNNRRNSGRSGIDFNKLISTESGGNSNAVSEKFAVGLTQVLASGHELGSPLDDYNKKNNTSYTTNDLKDSKTSIAVGKWYLEEEIPRLLKSEGFEDNDVHRLMAYNWGIGNMRKWKQNGSNPNSIPKETINYINKILGS